MFLVSEFVFNKHKNRTKNEKWFTARGLNENFGPFCESYRGRKAKNKQRSSQMSTTPNECKVYSKRISSLRKQSPIKRYLRRLSQENK